MQRAYRGCWGLAKLRGGGRWRTSCSASANDERTFRILDTRKTSRKRLYELSAAQHKLTIRAQDSVVVADDTGMHFGAQIPQAESLNHLCCFLTGASAFVLNFLAVRLLTQRLQRRSLMAWP